MESEATSRQAEPFTVWFWARLWPKPFARWFGVARRLQKQDVLPWIRQSCLCTMPRSTSHLYLWDSMGGGTLDEASTGVRELAWRNLGRSKGSKMPRQDFIAGLDKIYPDGHEHNTHLCSFFFSHLPFHGISSVELSKPYHNAECAGGVPHVSRWPVFD